MSPYGRFHSPMRYRSLFLSDLHLGSRRCRADKLLAFLRLHEADHIYLVGDTFDFWHRRAVHWTPQHDFIIDLLCRREQQGVKIVRLPGNHDPLSLTGEDINPQLTSIAPTAGPIIHKGADKRRYLVLHGDCCDFWPGRSYAISRLGSGIDWYLLRRQELMRSRRTGRSVETPAPLRLINRVGSLLKYGCRIEQRLIELARRHDADGIICGHLHKPALQTRDGVLYANCGDWVSNLSAIAEDTLGRFSLIDWSSCPSSLLSDTTSTITVSEPKSETATA
ncbi:UDP-2,3-diacylglucosamine diphosphatase [Brenneria goodwinii]|nr:UDP-2,3-diacylglucosamine diphosphatase [Brenneria goodwinii]MCG8154681.1 UDP-2,3-diacylglucosamine diphosphatase [Brenneria goodwinii]MCG8159983.1 UDP-2,3-diacylglucosamine diphosphatase [Brenneria goodwinii]MCG8163919.1 UDP-2,3-diacylglucosamine diphosphatase [Brenneria goodwinii]MCG8168528.1 UDP-2,3-diacylglucosamine diphosphatase [Brenneria goodwinii]MCG8173917.1 UDP-2,3-diacylglucosamine diphosphatase [Brenneria goodwinii]